MNDHGFVPDPPTLLGLFALPAESRYTHDLVALVWQIATPAGHKIEIEYRQADELRAFATFAACSKLVANELTSLGLLRYGADRE